MEEIKNKFVARQAIFDHNQNTYAYELLYRNSLDDFYNCSEPEKASTKIILQNQLYGDLSNLCSQKKAFINFDEKTLLANVPLVLDRNAVVLELLKTINVTPDVIKVVSDLYKKGYILALDDYDFSPKWEQLFPYISIIKVDREDIPFEKIAALKNSKFVADKKIKIVVERIETHQQFNMLIQIGIDYFQGYFFHKPEISVGHFIKPVKLNLLLLFAEVCQLEMNFDTLAEIISQDVSLVNGVLKLVNLEIEKNRVEISSIKQAVTFLGTDKIKQFIAIIAMSKLSSDCNNELLRESLVRGKMMEYISFSPAFLKIRGLAFITGVMSHIGAILNCSLEKIIMDLPLAEEIKTALVNKKGLLHDALEIAKHYEFSDNQYEPCTIMAKHDISEEMLLMNYHDALKWCCATCP
ncbi:MULTISPECIES: EAL and HDOD domain-containing protein [Colwellia]|uniref:Histidine kinase n=1 Tax=Colwellia marinimaniae TaxID=1513592 RepID=A0ABQ0MWJ5_9GAMM|nr:MULTISPECIES: HDOD domain-containing protein [Colwellia]GAW96718.1 histidine kinase [Colwellia marinimaniae]